MGQFIVKLEGQYLIWSTVVDAPITRGLTLEELREYTVEEAKEEALRSLEERLMRVEEKGTSSRMHSSAEGTITFNNAGVGNTELSVEQIVEFYVRNGARGDRPVGKKRD